MTKRIKILTGDLREDVRLKYDQRYRDIRQATRDWLDMSYDIDAIDTLIENELSLELPLNPCLEIPIPEELERTSFQTKLIMNSTYGIQFENTFTFPIIDVGS